MSGRDLLEQFRVHGSEDAFRELVGRYTGLVYSAAKRRLADDALAQEATQVVFIRLAKTLPPCGTDAELIGWIHRTTVHVAVDLWRSETRRRTREQEALVMHDAASENTSWNEIAPLLDEALVQLNDTDRQTILVRFFEGKSMRELGTTFSISEDAAKMRVSRAIERLRKELSSRGVTVSAALIGSLMMQHGVEAAPAQLAAALAAAKFAPTHAAFGASGTLAAVKVIAGFCLVAGLAIGLFLRWDFARQPAHIAPVTAVSDEASPATRSSGEGSGEDLPPLVEPDPAQLLRAAFEARGQLRSGALQLYIATQHLRNGRQLTNHYEVKVSFDGPRRCFDSVGPEYSYTAAGAKEVESMEKNFEHAMDREASIRAGLIERFEAHVVSIYDGFALFRYREKDGEEEGTVIEDPGKGSSYYLFDPRLLGFGGTFLVTHTLEGFSFPPKIELLGQETVGGIRAWHLRAGSGALARHWWLDASNPIRVLQSRFNGDTYTSSFEGIAPQDPFPAEVLLVSDPRPDGSSSRTRITRQEAQFNIEIDPAAWTLAGLKMKVGTSVADSRVMRIIGYWTGSGLSGSGTPEGDHGENPQDITALRETLERKPASEEGWQAASWFLLNTPDGDDVQRAAEVVLREHIARPDLKRLVQALPEFRHRSSTNLLLAALAHNPEREIQAHACFGLATLFKAQFQNGKNEIATAEARKYFERVIAEFGDAGAEGPKLRARAEAELQELNRLLVGMNAPDTAGRDFTGRSLRLSDYRGQVVVLVFWTASTQSDLVEIEKVRQQLGDKPVALIGVNRDRDRERARKVFTKHKITWPSFHEEPDGPIFKMWNVQSWPTIIVLDQEGTIRFRDLQSWDIAKAVGSLLNE